MYFCTLIYFGLFNKTVSSSGYTESDDRIIKLIMNWKGYRMDWV